MLYLCVLNISPVIISLLSLPLLVFRKHDLVPETVLFPSQFGFSKVSNKQ